jgi:hypothetical protein
VFGSIGSFAVSPTAIRLASDGGRLLFIQWERPALLEEFLLPPGKLDWRLPVWLDEQLNMHNMTKFTLSDKNAHRLIRLHSGRCRQDGQGNDYYRDELLPRNHRLKAYTAPSGEVSFVRLVPSQRLFGKKCKL